MTNFCPLVKEGWRDMEGRREAKNEKRNGLNGKKKGGHKGRPFQASGN
jgi:hypothetical protein